jgi:hypothetical protein
MWTYSPARLDFVRDAGIEVCAADEIVPRRLFQQVVAGAEVRNFSDMFRYAVLHQHGGLWMDSGVVMIRPFPFHGDYFFNFQWGHCFGDHLVCGNVI